MKSAPGGLALLDRGLPVFTAFRPWRGRRRVRLRFGRFRGQRPAVPFRGLQLVFKFLEDERFWIRVRFYDLKNIFAKFFCDF
jgi:hypothetical protein